MAIPRSLKWQLLSWVIPALLLSLGVGLWISTTLLDEQAEAAYDRSLAGVVRALDLNISTASGGLALEQPYRLLEFFQLTASGNVYYHVSTEDGLAEIGHPRLPLPHGPLQDGQLYFYNTTYLGNEPVRVATMARQLDLPSSESAPETAQRPSSPPASAPSRVIIQVAESLEGRHLFTQSILIRSIGRDVLVILLSAVLLVAGIIIALRPLNRLRNEMRRRHPDDLRPIDTQDIPAEVLPLVDAVNQHMARFSRQAEQQRQFLDDASHQLRTPLSVLRTQIGYALRENDPAETHEALRSMASGLDRAVRVTNQMLALARARDAGLQDRSAARSRFDLGLATEEAVRFLLANARARRLQYDLDLPDEPVMLAGDRLLVQEAIVNLIDNAIRYSPERGTVSISLSFEASCALVCIDDSGPGMGADDLAQAGVRFRRGAAGKGKSGAGLGLAIVRTIVEAHDGKLILQTSEQLGGLQARLVFPLG